MAHFDYDLFIIGAGSGGVRAARIASKYGAKIAMAEDSRLGGTCVNLGCIPKKLLVYASHFADNFEDAQGYGWTVGETQFDWPKLIANKNTEIDRISGFYKETLDNAGVNLFRERAVLTSPHTVRLESSGQEISAQHILVAVGSTAFKPDIPGQDLAITSNEAFYLETLPHSITIVGGGYIAVEFAGIFNGLGVPTTLVYRREKILRGFDHDMRATLQDEMQQRGVSLHLNADPVEIMKTDEKYRVTLNNGSIFETDLVMYATGRVPNTKNLGLETAGVALGERGKILVDDYYKSSVDSIYAVGDVIDRFTLTPLAIREAMIFAEHVFNNGTKKLDYSVIPTAVFSQPEIGVVGLTEDEARQTFEMIDIYKSNFRELKHTMSGRQTRMLMKLIVDGKTDRVLGCHIIGEAAAEIVQLMATAITLGAKKTDLDQTIALHPSTAEELVTMKEKWTPST